MQQFLNFIIRNSYRLLFLILLSWSVFLIIQNNAYHRSKVLTSSNYIAGVFYEKIDNINQYFHLKEVNKELVEENTYLKKLLFNNKDTLLMDMSQLPVAYATFKIVPAKVIKNSFNKYENYLSLNSGSLAGIKQDMGVINGKGVLGIIDKTSSNFSTVLSILNTKSKIDAKIKNTNYTGTLTWNAKNAGFVQLIDVARIATIKKGDTIVTSGQSMIFPENIPIGKVEKAYSSKESNYFVIDVRLFNDMTNLGYVYIIENTKREELNQLEKVTNEQQ